VQVRLTLDAHSIPGVWADDDVAAFFGLGALHGLHRPLQSLLLPHAGAGRLMARLAPAGPLRHLDTTAHRLDLPERGRAVARGLSAWARQRVQAYLAGLASGLRRGRPEAATRLVVRLLGPPSLEDLCSGFMLSAYLGLAEGQERMERLIVEAVAEGADPKLLEAMFAPHLAGWDPARLATLPRRRPGPGFAAHALAGVGGSNAWAVDGARSTSGAPLLAGDPHLQVNQLPALFYPVRVRLPGDYWLGASIPGLPGLAVGRNRHVAWSGTFAVADNVDFFIEEAPEREATTRQVELRRRGLPPLSLRFVETPRGVLESPDGPGPKLSTRWAGAEDAHEAMQAYLRLPFTRSAAEADEVLGEAHTLSLHFVIADRGGEVRYRQVGRIPRRTEGWSGLWPAPADGPKWQGTFRAGELPGFVAEAGYVLSANEARPGPGGATLSTLAQPSYRYDRIEAWLTGRARHDVASMCALQQDLWSGQAARLSPVLLAALPDGPVARALAAWDHVVAPDRPGAHAFSIAYRAALSALATDLGGAWFEGALDRSEASVWWATGLDRALADAARWPEARRRALGDRLGAVAQLLPKPWGEVQQLRLPHLVYGGLPDPLGLDRGPFPLPGSIATVCQGNLRHDGGAEIAVAPALRFVTDLSSDEAKVSWPGGVDGRPGSPTYDSLLAAHLSGEYLTMTPPAEGEVTWLTAGPG